MKSVEFARTISRLTEEGKKFAVATVVRIEGSSLGKPGFKAVVTDDEKVVFGTLGGVCPESAIVETASKAIARGEPRTVRIYLEEAGQALAGMAKSQSEDEIHVETFCGGMMEVYVEPFLPSDRLILVGQGGKDDVEDALVSLGKMLDFEVVVLDRTPVLTTEPDLVVKDIKEDLSNFTFKEGDFAVVLTKGAYDIPALQGLSDKKLKYVGMLASRNRLKEDFSILHDKGVKQSFLDSIHAPVGVNINAISPTEIAVSVMAEIISFRHPKKEKTGSKQ